MKATALYRTASGLLFLWAAGNTYGLLMFWHVGYGSLSGHPKPANEGHLKTGQRESPGH